MDALFAVPAQEFLAACWQLQAFLPFCIAKARKSNSTLEDRRGKGGHGCHGMSWPFALAPVGQHTECRCSCFTALDERRCLHAQSSFPRSGSRELASAVQALGQVSPKKVEAKGSKKGASASGPFHTHVMFRSIAAEPDWQEVCDRDPQQFAWQSC